MMFARVFLLTVLCESGNLALSTELPPEPSGCEAYEREANLNLELTAKNGPHLQPLSLLFNTSRQAGSECEAFVGPKGPGLLALMQLQGCLASIEWEQQFYQLQEIYLHVPSRTQVDGRDFAMEAQLVHRSKDGHVLVLVQLFALGDEDNFLNSLQIANASFPKGVIETGDPYELFEPSARTSYYNWDVGDSQCPQREVWVLARSVADLSQKQMALIGTTSSAVQALLLQTQNTSGISEFFGSGEHAQLSLRSVPSVVWTFGVPARPPEFLLISAIVVAGVVTLGLIILLILLRRRTRLDCNPVTSSSSQGHLVLSESV